MDNLIVMYDENGHELKLEYLDIMFYAGEEYVLLRDSDGCGVIFRSDPDGESYCGIDSESFLSELFDRFKERAAGLEML